MGTGSVPGSRVAPVGRWVVSAPTLLPWQEGSRLRDVAVGAIPLLPRCLSFPLELEAACEEQPGVRVLSGSGWFCAAWMRVGEQSARPVAWKIAFLEAAHGPGDSDGARAGSVLGELLGQEGAEPVAGGDRWVLWVRIR